MRVFSIVLLISLLVLSFVLPFGKANAQTSPDVIQIYQQDMYDKYGHLERNLDGTYYPGDRILFYWTVGDVTLPSCRDGCRVGVTVTSDVGIIERGQNYMIVQFTPGIIGYGEHKTQITVFTATIKGNIWVVFNQFNFNSRLVPYNPTMNTYPYTVLNDKEKYSYQDRTAIALNYLGSKGNGDNNIFTNNQIFPDRRLFLNDTSHYQSWSNNTEWQFQDFPMTVNGTQGQIPVGIKHVIHEDVFNITRQSPNPYIFMDKAGYSTQYYITTPKNQTIIDDATAVGIKMHLEWPPIGYDKEVDYTLPPPKNPLANHVIITTNPPAKSLIVHIREQDYQPKSGVYETVRQFAYDSVMKQTKDPILANMVQNDMPLNEVFAISNRDNLDLEMPKFHVYIPEFADQNYNFTDVADYPSSVELSAIVDGKTFTKQYSSYDFNGNYNLDIDMRQNIPLDIARQQNGRAIVNAEWDISGVDGGNIVSCLEHNCIIEPRADQLTVYNEFGGSASGHVPPIPSQANPFTEENKENMKWALILIGMAFLTLWLAQKYGNVLNGILFK